MTEIGLIFRRRRKEMMMNLEQGGCVSLP